MYIKRIKSKYARDAWGNYLWQGQIDTWKQCDIVAVGEDRLEVWDKANPDEPNLLIACTKSMFNQLSDRGLVKP